MDEPDSKSDLYYSKELRDEVVKLALTEGVGVWGASGACRSQSRRR